MVRQQHAFAKDIAGFQKLKYFLLTCVGRNDQFEVACQYNIEILCGLPSFKKNLTTP